MGWKSMAVVAALAVSLAAGAAEAKSAQACGQACLERIGDQYRAAYVKHDKSLAPFAAKVRFTENNMVVPFPDGSWDAITQEVGPPLTFSDPATGSVGIYTAIMMHDTPAFMAIRLKVVNGRITEVEHLMSTKRLVSAPPTPFGDVNKLVHDPLLPMALTATEKRSRAELIRLADGYFSTLSRNDGTLHTKFSPTCHRIENGFETASTGCEGPFRLGQYHFNERVRREPIMVDEARGLVMFRGFIDHKGTVLTFKTTDGKDRTSPFHEPHTWSFIETFKVRDGMIGPVEADFIGSPYYAVSPWTVGKLRGMNGE